MSDSLLTPDWIRRLSQFERVYLGLSGGLDSMALLHALARCSEIQPKLQAVHVHHGLSKHADAWQTLCERTCEALDITLLTHHVTLESRANLEAEARKLRYHVFESLLGHHDGLVVAHHQDDQAETLLLQLVRGAGVDGLAAMSPERALGQGKLLRPLLTCRRDDIHDYACLHELAWVEDDSNQNEKLARNYMRRQVLPLLQTRWPSVATNISRTASHCQEAKANLDALAKQDARILGPRTTLAVAPLLGLEKARVMNVLRAWLKQSTTHLPSTAIMKQIHEGLLGAGADKIPVVQWNQVTIRRYQNVLYLVTEGSEPVVNRARRLWQAFPESLDLQTGLTLEAKITHGGFQPPLGAQIEVGFRLGGETMRYRGQTKALKTLMQTWQIPPWQRDYVPLLFIQGELALVVGHAISDHFYHEGQGYQCELTSK